MKCLQKQSGDVKTYLCANATLEDTAGPACDGGLRYDGTRVARRNLISHSSLVGGRPGVRVVDLQGTLEDVLRESVIEAAADGETIGDTVALGDGDRGTRANTVDLEE